MNNIYIMNVHHKRVAIKSLVVFTIFSTGIFDYVRASHTIQSQYTGQGSVLLENEELRDTEGEQIACILSGEPYANITWKWKDGQTPAPEHYFTWTTSEIPTDPKLSSSTLDFIITVTEAQKREIKTRTIYAIGAHTDDPSKSRQCDDVILSFIWKPLKSLLSINKDTFGIGEDITAQLTCQLTDKGNPEGQVRWINNGNLQSESEYNTQIISIPVTKDINGDRWQCYYYNAAGDGEYSDDAMINVHWIPEGTAVMSVNKNPLVIGQDSQAQLTCQLIDKGNPGGQVSWIKNRNMQSRSEYNTQAISIPVTKDIDGDRWRCYYYNEAGDGEYSDEVMTNIHWSPGDASIAADTLAPKLDDILTFTCSGERGNPPGQVLWYLDNLLVANTTSKQYTVTGVNESHNGNWDCMLKNYLNDGAISQAIPITVLCLPSVHIDYITYEFTPGYVNFNLKTKNAFAASALEISVCSEDDVPSCEVAESNIDQHSNLEQRVGLPESSDGTIYNVTFTFWDNYRYIVTQHGIALKGTVVQSQVSTILAVLFGTLLILAIVTIIALVYVFHWRKKATGTNDQRENSVHYVNVGSGENSGDVTRIQAAPEYEDVNTAATTNGQRSNIENTTYMDLDQNEIQQTRNRPAEVTVYQSLN